jgi:hypothetical protein
VKNKTVGWIGILCCLLALGAASAPFRTAGRVTFQETRRTQDDYMSALLSRDTKTLGLKENPVLQRMLRQPAIKWTVRSTRAHVLF